MKEQREINVAFFMFAADAGNHCDRVTVSAPLQINIKLF
jgi:hypothetical protein